MIQVQGIRIFILPPFLELIHVHIHIFIFGKIEYILLEAQILTMSRNNCKAVLSAMRQFAELMQTVNGLISCTFDTVIQLSMVDCVN